MKRNVLVCLGATLVLASTAVAQAQTIYPLNRAEILSGAKFDLKVEFPGAPPSAVLRVTINGADAASIVGGNASVVEREDGGAPGNSTLRSNLAPDRISALFKG